METDSISLEQCFDEDSPKSNSTLVGRILCSITLNRQGVTNVIKGAWKTDESFTILDWGKNTFVFTFQSEADLCRVICEGPWSVMGHTLVLRKWNSSKDLKEIDFSFSPFWV